MHKCNQCGNDVDLPYSCNYCGRKHCSRHRLPEKHGCLGTSGQRNWEVYKEGGRSNKSRKFKQQRRVDERSDASKKPSGVDAEEGTEEKGKEKEDNYNSVKPETLGTRSPKDELFTDSGPDVAPDGSIGKKVGRVEESEQNARPSSNGRSKVTVLCIALLLVAGVGVFFFTPFIGPTYEIVVTLPGGDDGAVAGTKATTIEPTQTARSAGQATPTPTFEPQGAVSRERIERAVHEEINKRRAEHGLSSLDYDEELVTIARYHSQDMGENEYFAHTSPDGEEMGDRYEKFGYNCRVPAGGNQYYTGAENIAYSYLNERVSTNSGIEYYDTAEEVAHGLVNQWMNSSGHRQNILMSEWRVEGIGVYVIEVDGKTRVYATQNFC